MAGTQTLEMVERETNDKSMTTTTQNQWKVQYARCFTYPSSYLTTAAATTTITTPILSPLSRNRFQPIWLSSSGLSTVSLHPSADASAADSILTINLQGILTEEHFISKLHFVWPQVTCLSGFPTRGSVVVIASYLDKSNEKQKFAMRFSGVSEAEEFITSVEDIFSKKFPNGSPVVDDLSAISFESVPDRAPVVDDFSAISSESEFVPPYRPDTSNVFIPICDSTVSKNLNTEDQQDSQIQDTLADSQANFVTFPPSFTSLVSSCSAELEQDKLTLALGAEPQDNDVKAQIAKYMQDASFLDMVSKVNEVITELGGDYAL